ncbi:MAG: DNA polymerase II, partial [Hafnia sp.]
MANTPQQGFVLTRHWRDTPAGVSVELWLATDNGPQKVSIAPQQAVAFLPAEQLPQAETVLKNERHIEIKPLPMKDFHQRPVVGIYCRSYRQLMNLEKTLKEQGMTLYEADIRPPDRYLM